METTNQVPIHGTRYTATKLPGRDSTISRRRSGKGNNGKGKHTIEAQVSTVSKHNKNSGSATFTYTDNDQ